MKILFLYTELADYTLACLKALKRSVEGVDIYVVHYPINPEAPFEFDFGTTGIFKNIKLYPDFKALNQYVDSIQPDKIVVSGWGNKWYIRICIAFRNKSVCILSMDNHWIGNLKQRVFTIIFKLSLIKVFKKIWVPGKPQILYAKKLGFKDQNIIDGFYCCDTDLYLSLGRKALFVKEVAFPKKFLCVARYIPSKNLDVLCDAFIQWKLETNNDWELWCAGTGEGFEERKKHPDIRHLGFVQKSEWANIINQAGVFVLPSIFEPWGVVVHEFAASGFPLLLSKYVGAGDLFLKFENGLSFDPHNKEELIEQLHAISILDNKTLHSMGAASNVIAQQIVLEKWVKNLVSI